MIPTSKWKFTGQETQNIAGREVKMPRMLTNDGQCAVMEGDDRVCLVDAHAKSKRGERWKVECPLRDQNARLIAKAPVLMWIVEEMHDGRTGWSAEDMAGIRAVLNYIENGDE